MPGSIGAELPNQNQLAEGPIRGVKLNQAVATILINEAKFTPKLSTRGQLHAALGERSIGKKNHLLAEGSVVLSHLLDGLAVNTLWPESAQPEVHQTLLVSRLQRQDRGARIRDQAIGVKPTKRSAPLPEVAQEVGPLAGHGVGCCRAAEARPFVLAAREGVGFLPTVPSWLQAQAGEILVITL